MLESIIYNGIMCGFSVFSDSYIKINPTYVSIPENTDGEHTVWNISSTRCCDDKECCLDIFDQCYLYSCPNCEDCKCSVDTSPSSGGLFNVTGNEVFYV